VFTVAECVISWKAGLQDIVALSTKEADYMVAVELVQTRLPTKIRVCIDY